MELTMIKILIVVEDIFIDQVNYVQSVKEVLVLVFFHEDIQ